MNKLFPGQQDNERVILVVRQHWFVFFLHLLAWGLFAVILLAADYIITHYFSELREEPIAPVVNLIETLYLMFLILALLIMWVLYYLNVNIITNERVVDITQQSLLHHTVSELHLNRIQDVTAEVHGFFETFLDYGNVHLQTAGETERFVFNNVGNPAKISKMILDLYEQLPPEEKLKSD